MHPRLFLKFFVMSICLLAMSNCQRIRLQGEYKKINSWAQEITGNNEVIFKEFLPNENALSESPDISFLHDLTINKAVTLALLNNKVLKMALQEIGVAKADLIEVGLMKNPLISGLFAIPSEKNMVTNIEIDAPLISLTDLWLIPLRKKVWCAHLERVMSEFINTMLDTITVTNKAYNKILLYEILIEKSEEFILNAKTLSADLKVRQKYGFASDFDRYESDRLVYQMQSRLYSYKSSLYETQLALCTYLALDPSYCTDLKFPQTLMTQEEVVYAIDDLLSYALEYHPTIIIAQKNCTYYANLLAYEKAHVINNFDVGVGFKREFNRSQGTGPYFSTEVPLYNQNQSAIARAEYNLKKAHIEFENVNQQKKAEILSLHNRIIQLQKIIVLYRDKMIRLQKKALDYTITYEKQMQITIPTVLKAQRDLYKIQNEYAIALYKRARAYSKLEKAVGKLFAST